MTGAQRDEVYLEIEAERLRQDSIWGVQDWPDGTGEEYAQLVRIARMKCAVAFSSDRGTWEDIFLEEAYEALAETDPVKLRQELVQVIAVSVAWVEAIDRRVA